MLKPPSPTPRSSACSPSGRSHAGVGVGIAVPPALNRWRLGRLLETGCDAIRAGLHPPAPALLQLCDGFRILVLNEHRQIGTLPGHLGSSKTPIRRDRIHADAFAWCIGSEEMNVQRKPIGIARLGPMRELRRTLDPTWNATCAMNCGRGVIARSRDAAGFRLDMNGTNGALRTRGT